MPDDDVEFLTRYRTKTLYTAPDKAGKGAYATLIGDSEEVIGEIDITTRSKLAISAFYVNDRADFSTLKVTKLRFNKRHGWQLDGEIVLNHFQIAQMQEFVSIMSSLDLRETKKTRIALENIHFGALGALLKSNEGTGLLQKLAASPDLQHDIYAVAAKRAVLDTFEANLKEVLSEANWQAFFESNPWIFGHGLNYVFLNQVGKKLETLTTGSAFDRPGKRADGLMLTRAEVSQYVLVEIKKNDTDLLRGSTYRPGCWAVSEELSGAVTQTQKTVFEFTRNRFRDRLKDASGDDTDTEIHSVEPRSFLVIGNLAQIKGNDDKVACFELFRRNIRSPEILTFDELYYRANCIVSNISTTRLHRSCLPLALLHLTTISRSSRRCSRINVVLAQRHYPTSALLGIISAPRPETPGTPHALRGT
jgi:hypothetical protein